MDNIWLSYPLLTTMLLSRNQLCYPYCPYYYIVSLDWFKGKSTGNNVFSYERWGVPAKFPLNQSIDSAYYRWPIEIDGFPGFTY
jgi:hypothetical protein